MRIYLAGPLFTQAERDWNERLAQALTKAGHTVFLPQVETQKLPHPDAGLIFQTDLEGVRTAEAVVAVLDGADADSGTCFECGIAYALGIPIVAVRTDFRGGGDALPGQVLATINLMLSEAAAKVVWQPDPRADFAAFAASVCQALAGLPPQLAVLQRPPR
jgi:nucleoside 2-deoxyribosyltransferase